MSTSTSFHTVSANSLILCLTTPATLGALAAASAKRKFVVVCSSWGDDLVRKSANITILSPALVLAKLKAQGGLKEPVISFSDQLLGTGPTFTSIEGTDGNRLYSLFDAVVVLRWRPSLYLAKHYRHLWRLRVRLERLPQNRLQPRVDDTEPEIAITRLLVRESLSDARRLGDEWLASDLYAARTRDRLERVRSEALRDIEGLLRTGYRMADAPVAAENCLKQIVEYRCARQVA